MNTRQNKIFLHIKQAKNLRQTSHTLNGLSSMTAKPNGQGILVSVPKFCAIFVLKVGKRATIFSLLNALDQNVSHVRSEIRKLWYKMQ